MEDICHSVIRVVRVDISSLTRWDDYEETIDCITPFEATPRVLDFDTPRDTQSCFEGQCTS